MAIAKISVKDESELQKIIVDDVSAVEEGLTVIASNMPVDAKHRVDVLCNDEDGQLVILKLSVKENDDMFFEGLKHLAYVNNAKPILKFSYKDHKINDSKATRIIYLAPSFSPQLVEVASQMQGIHIDLYKWEYFQFDDKKAFHLEPAWLSESTKSKIGKPRPIKPKRPKTIESEAEKEPEKATEEFIIPPVETEPERPEKESKQAKKKSIFAL